MATTEPLPVSFISVPTETLRTLLDAWAKVSSDWERDEVPLEADDAYDALRALIPQETE